MKKKATMKSKTARFLISAEKRVNLGSMPTFIHFGHRALEKSNPTPVERHNNTSKFMVPKDVMRLTVTDHKLLEDIESIEFVYYKKP